LVLRSEASSRCFRQKVSRPGLLFQTFPRLFPVLRVKKSSEPVVLRVSELPLVAILNVKTNASANQSERNEPFERYRRGHSGGRAERTFFVTTKNSKREKEAILMKILTKEKDEGFLKQNACDAAASKSATHAFVHLFSSLTP
tara:strand:+ start:198 stop:626 length:429 start_codon:yes stop_codon:yes gene_type:complete